MFSRPNDERDKVRFELLIAVASLAESPAIFVAHETVLTSISEYECLGVGYFVGQHVIETGYKYSMSLDDAVVLALHATVVAKEYVEGVGGPIQLLWMKDRVVSPFHPINTAIYTENYLMSFERRAAELLFDAANPKLSEDEFKDRAEKFIKHVGFVRKYWRESFENKDILEMLMHPGAPQHRQATTSDSSPPQPSPDSPARSGES